MSSASRWILVVWVVGAVGGGPAGAQAPAAGSGANGRLAEADFEAVRLKKIVTAVRITDAITLARSQTIARSFVIKLTRMVDF